MIVIATHDNINYLDTLIKSINNYGTNGHKVLIVDTNSITPDFFKYLSSLKEASFTNNLNIEITKTLYSGYDSGGYIWAYKNFIEENYIFLQDSMEIKHPEWITIIEEKLKKSDVVAWRKFPRHLCPFDNPHQERWLYELIGTRDYDEGIFGPVFSTKRSVLYEIEQSNLFIIPNNKEQQQGMERGWAIIFKKLGFIVDNIETWSFDNKDSIYMNKVFPKRR